MTQEELADLAGVRRETIIYLEQGKYMPSLKLAHDVARILEIPIEELFIFEEDGAKPAFAKATAGKEEVRQNDR